MISLDNVFEIENLNKVWKVIHSGITDDLMRDPLDYLAYEANLDQNLKQLRHSILNGNYKPRFSIILRSAKRDGLTRQLSFMEIEDLLVLKTICDFFQPELHKEFPEWVDFSRRLRTAFPKDETDYEGWFEHWLRHQNRLNQIIAKQDGWKYIVFSDISNFFPSINHSILRQIIVSRIKSDEKVINLLFYILESMVPKPDYCCDHRQGLPQENHDASRILAHTLLFQLDNQFQAEGKEGRYARWVDDIVVAVNEKSDGRRMLSRIQKEVESKGLFLNNSKCRILSAEEALEELWLEENEYLDYVHKITENREILDKDKFEKRLENFLNCNKRKNWDRILRRYYTESRRLESSYLEKYVFKHLNEFPSECKVILSYLVARPFVESILDKSFKFLMNRENCYSDVEILIYEFLMYWSIPDIPAIRNKCKEYALDHFHGRNGFPRPFTDYSRGLITLFCYKVSGRSALDEISKFYEVSNDLQFLKYAFCCLAATQDFKDIAFEKASTLEDISIRRLEKFFHELERHSKDYLSIIKNYTKPQNKKLPERVIFNIRALPLIRICRRDKDFRSNWVSLCESILEKLEKPKNKNLHDHLSISFIKTELMKA